MLMHNVMVNTFGLCKSISLVSCVMLGLGNHDSIGQILPSSLWVEISTPILIMMGVCPHSSRREDTQLRERPENASDPPLLIW